MNDQLLEKFNAYLRVWPGETERLKALGAQLRVDNAIASRKNMTGHVTASIVILNKERTQVLLVDHKHHQMWLSPGGHLEAGEDPQEACLREAEEETEIADIALVGELPINIDSHPITARPEKDETEHFHHDYLYLGVAPEGALLAAQKSEVNGVKWFDIENLAETAPHMVRVTAKLQEIVASETIPQL